MTANNPKIKEVKSKQQVMYSSSALKRSGFGVLHVIYFLGTCSLVNDVIKKFLFTGPGIL